jgi:hypothetical protein
MAPGHGKDLASVGIVGAQRRGRLRGERQPALTPGAHWSLLGL